MGPAGVCNKGMGTWVMYSVMQEEGAMTGELNEVLGYA